jgi:glycosyltransferase involved in cell wall biosynthesis
VSALPQSVARRSTADEGTPACAVPVTLLVMTYNEAGNIADCLDSVPFVHEKIVIDSGSDDDTVAIARAHGARVISQPWLGFGRQRNFATTLASSEWILFLDADERLSAALANELSQRLPELSRDPASVGLLPRTTYFMGQPMRWYRGMQREFKARLYHRDRARWSEPRVHESLQYQGAAVRFVAPLIHLHDPTLVHGQLKALHYAELKARDWLQRDRPLRTGEWGLVFVGTFLKDYLLRLAILDGARGWIAAYLAAHYAVYKRLRYFEMRRVADSKRLAATALPRWRNDLDAE